MCNYEIFNNNQTRNISESDTPLRLTNSKKEPFSLVKYNFFENSLYPYRWGKGDWITIFQEKIRKKKKNKQESDFFSWSFINIIEAPDYYRTLVGFLRSQNWNCLRRFFCNYQYINSTSWKLAISRTVECIRNPPR